MMMQNQNKLGEREAIAFIATNILTKIYLSTPAFMISHVGSAAWMSRVLSGLVTLLGCYFTLKLLKKFPHRNYPQLLSEIAGPIPGFLMVCAGLFFWGLDISTALRRFAEMVEVVALTETPISIIVFTLMSTSVLIAYLGINVIAQACYLSFPFSLIAILIICLTTYPQWQPAWLFPLLGEGLENILYYGVTRSSDFVEFTLIILLPLVLYQNQMSRVGYKSIFIALSVFLLVLISYSMTFPPEVAEEPFTPLYMMARSVYLGRFIQRIEAIFVLFWIVGGYLWISTGLYGLSTIISQQLNLPDYRPLLLPVAVILVSAAFIPANLPDTVEISEAFSRQTTWMFVLGQPILLLILAKIRGKGSTAHGQK